MKARASPDPLARTAVRSRTLAALAVLALLLAALALDGRALLGERRYNRALAEEDWAAAATHESAHGRLARAWLLARSGEADAAIAAYGALGAGDGTALARVARYNLAGIYLERAQKLPDDSEQRVPLVELAKQLYRELLREQPAHWDARYNLARALQLVPDLPVETPAEERNPERAPRAPRANPAYEQLP